MADKPVTQDELKKKLQEIYKYIEDELALVYKETLRIDTLRADVLKQVNALEKRVDVLEKKCNA
jgi:hypothetical protein